MNYRHGYHVGSFTDVFKHIVLTILIESMKRKDAAFCYIDTHGGAGLYDLSAAFSEKTKEYKTGIEKIIQGDNPPSLVKHFLHCIHQINNDLLHAQYAALRYYPGSPVLARKLLRPHDRLITSELHPEEYQSLRNTFAGDKQAAIHHTDGYLGLKAFLPPKERRGLILIDPPYENTDEFAHIARSLQTALKRFETGVYAIWYPIKDKASVDAFYRTLKANVNKPILRVELTIFPDLPSHLNGSGVAIINPPFKLEETLNETLPWVWKSLTINDQGAFRVDAQ
jgi:23S rRNA (adenine2030-N6)-methyltransferase